MGRQGMCVCADLCGGCVLGLSCCTPPEGAVGREVREWGDSCKALG